MRYRQESERIKKPRKVDYNEQVISKKPKRNIKLEHFTHKQFGGGEKVYVNGDYAGFVFFSNDLFSWCALDSSDTIKVKGKELQGEAVYSIIVQQKFPNKTGNKV